MENRQNLNFIALIDIPKVILMCKNYSILQRHNQTNLLATFGTLDLIIKGWVKKTCIFSKWRYFEKDH